MTARGFDNRQKIDPERKADTNCDGVCGQKRDEATRMQDLFLLSLRMMIC